MTYHVQFLLLVLAGWVNRQQQDVIDYLQEENRVLRAGLRGKRLSLSDDDRRRLVVKAQALGREAPTEESAVALLFGLVASGQIRLRRIDGYQHLADVLARGEVAA